MQGITRKLLYVALMLGVAGCVSSDRNVKVEAGTVKIIRVKGMARYSVDQGEWHPVEKGLEFKGGVLIQTGPKSLVDVCMNEGHPISPEDGSEKTSAHVVRIFENSALQIKRLIKRELGTQFSEDIALDLRAGQMLGNVGMLFPESRYEIKLPNGQVDIRGGIFMVNSSGVVNVLQGKVVTTKKNADGSESQIEIHPRESFDPATGTVTRLTEEQVRFSYLYNSYESAICGVPLPQPLFPAESTPNSGVPHGSGTGGALRKFQ